MQKDALRNQNTFPLKAILFIINLNLSLSFIHI